MKKQMDGSALSPGFYDLNEDGVIAVSYTHLDVYKRQTLYLSPSVVIRENVEIQRGGEIVEVVHKEQDLSLIHI